MNLGLWGSPLAPHDKASPPVLLVAGLHTSRQPAQRGALRGSSLPVGCTITHGLWGALQSLRFRVSRAWLRIPAAQFLPSERPCLAEPVSSLCAGGDEGAVTQGVEGSSRVLSVWPTPEARFSAELPTALSPHQRVLDPRPFPSWTH